MSLPKGDSQRSSTIFIDLVRAIKPNFMKLLSKIMFLILVPSRFSNYVDYCSAAKIA